MNPQMVEKLSEFEIPDARETFLATLRSVVDVSGQRSPRSANLHRWKTFQSC